MIKIIPEQSRKLSFADQQAECIDILRTDGVIRAVAYAVLVMYMAPVDARKFVYPELIKRLDEIRDLKKSIEASGEAEGVVAICLEEESVLLAIADIESQMVEQ